MNFENSLRRFLRGRAWPRQELVYWLVAWAAFFLVLLRSLIDSWDFPWYGNPDQDLVFLRDGLRLSRGEAPGYGDHPGLAQMLVVWSTLLLLRSISFFSVTPFSGGLMLGDMDWQLLFVATKIVNIVFVSFLVALCALLLRRWIGRSGAMLWGLMCVLSMALVSEVYQLRNEFYSSFLIGVAILLSIDGFASFGGRAIFDSGNRKAVVAGALLLIASFGAWLLVVFGLMAKVQVLPVLVAFLLAMLVVLAFWFRWRYLKFFILAVALISASVGLGGMACFSGLGVSVPQAILVLLFVSGPPALLLSLALMSCRFLGWRWRVLGWLLPVVGFVWISRLVFGAVENREWLRLLANPLSVRSYAVASNECAGGTLFCAVTDGLSGMRYLFERSVDSYLLAPVVGGIVLVGCVFVVVACFWPRLCRGSGGVDHFDSVASFAGCVCLLAAFGMAFLAGQRWAVDHYLSYQQPFLFAGIIVLSRRGLNMVWGWRFLLAVIALSVALLFVRYPAHSRVTYVKESLRVAPIPGRGDGSLCAAQHAGSEWKGSSLWVLCNGFKQSI